LRKRPRPADPESVRERSVLYMNAGECRSLTSTDLKDWTEQSRIRSFHE
jgi:hypothetical protein